jgi:hypothetical protein
MTRPTLRLRERRCEAESILIVVRPMPMIWLMKA